MTVSSPVVKAMSSPSSSVDFGAIIENVNVEGMSGKS